MSQPSLEVTGKTSEDAISKGLAQLGLPRDAVEIKVIREGSRGLLGLGSEEAIVRLTPRETAGSSTPRETAGSSTPRPTAPSSPPRETAPLEGTPSATETATPRMFRQTDAAAATTAPAEVGAEKEKQAPTAETASANGAEVARETLETMLHGMGLKARVEVQHDLAIADERGFVLNIVGDDLGILIGRRGETLRDLEYLTRLLVGQKTGKQIKLVVDVEGYRTRRERVLNELAKRMAERVQSNRQPITLEAMPPNERRIVHLALRDHPTVTTQSIGEGEHRRVMILPK